MNLPQLIGLKCVGCERQISSIADGSFCPNCGNPAHHACQRAGETGLRAERCARCAGDPAQADVEVRKALGLPEIRPAGASADSPDAIKCLRCKADLEFMGTKAFHEGTWLTMWSEFAVYVCKRCGRVELFAKGIGAEHRPH